MSKLPTPVWILRLRTRRICKMWAYGDMFGVCDIKGDLGTLALSFALYNVAMR